MASKHASRNVRSTAARDFIKIMEGLSYGQRPWDIFEDWTVMASCAIYNRIFKDPEVERQYLDVAGRYAPDKLDGMCRMLAIAMETLLEDPRDFLGEIFEGSDFANGNHGQFFTPWNLSVLIAQLSLQGAQSTQGRILTVSEPACGAGGMCLAACQVFAEAGMNISADVYFEAQDIDPTCSRMAYIQLSLAGAAAVVSCGDTLRMTQDWAWPTPAYVLNNVGSRLASQRMIDGMRSALGLTSQADEQGASGATEGRQELLQLPPARDYVQAELFEVGA